MARKAERAPVSRRSWLAPAAVGVCVLLTAPAESQEDVASVDTILAEGRCREAEPVLPASVGRTEGVHLLGSAALALAATGSTPPYAEAMAPSDFDNILLLASGVIAARDDQQARVLANDLVSAVEAYLEPVGDRVGSLPLAVPPRVEALELRDARSGLLDETRGDGLLVLARSGRLSHANGAIVVADGWLQISHASGSLIVATGGVDISHSNENVIVAGYYAAMGFDGRGRPQGWKQGDPELRARSSVISGNLLSIGHARGSLISAPGQVEVTHAKDVLVANSPPLLSSHGDSQQFSLESLATTRREFAEPLRDVKVLRVPHTERENGILLTLADEEEFRVHFGEPVEVQGGPHTRQLAGWTLAVLMGDRMIFENGSRYALVSTEEKPPDPLMTVLMVALSIAAVVLWGRSRLKRRG